MRGKKAMTNSIQEVMSLMHYQRGRAQRDLGFDTRTEDEANEMRKKKIRVDGSSTVESPTFGKDVETH